MKTFLVLVWNWSFYLGVTFWNYTLKRFSTCDSPSFDLNSLKIFLLQPIRNKFSQFSPKEQASASFAISIQRRPQKLTEEECPFHLLEIFALTLITALDLGHLLRSSLNCTGSRIRRRYQLEKNLIYPLPRALCSEFVLPPPPTQLHCNISRVAQRNFGLLLLLQICSPLLCATLSLVKVIYRFQEQF